MYTIVFLNVKLHSIKSETPYSSSHCKIPTRYRIWITKICGSVF